MQEVTKQLGPLTERVSLLSNNIERLYNSNGGPPGFLQTARKEDDGRFEMIFNILDEHKNDLIPLKAFIRDHAIREDQREADRKKEAELVATRLKDSEKRSSKRITIWMLIIAALTLILGIWDHRAAVAHAIAPPMVSEHSQLQPQVSTIPSMR